MKLRLGFGSLVAACAFSGCAQLDQSLHESSDSSGSDSFSHSSGSGAAATTGSIYRSDVISFTVASLDRPAGEGELLRGLGRIAELHGITNWQDAPETIEALKSVARDAELRDDQVARLRSELAPLGRETLDRAFGDEPVDVALGEAR